MPDGIGLAIAKPRTPSTGEYGDASVPAWFQAGHALWL